MEFRDLYKKYTAGECTEEEKAFVESEIERARIVGDEILKEHRPVEFTSVTDEEVLKAKRKFNTGAMIKTVLISLASCIVLAAAATAVICGLAVHGAGQNMHFSGTRAEEEVRTYIIEYIESGMLGKGGADGAKISYIYEDERDLQFRMPLSSSYYILEYEILANGYEFEVEFNTKTGDCVITDIDRD